jgi:hypothetical protein
VSRGGDSIEALRKIWMDGYNYRREEQTMTRTGNPIMQFFAYEHLPKSLHPVSKAIGDVARLMEQNLPASAETSAGLRKLLEAKDCFVRAALDKRVERAPAPTSAPRHANVVVDVSEPINPALFDAIDAVGPDVIVAPLAPDFAAPGNPEMRNATQVCPECRQSRCECIPL